MVNTNQGVDPNVARQFQTPFNANQLQGGGNAFNLGGIAGLQGNFNLQNTLQGARPGGLGNLPTSASQQPAGQGRFTNFGGQMPQFPQAGRGGVPVTMNGLPGNAARGSVGSNVAGINLGAAGRPGMDRGGPGGLQIPQPAANAGMQRGGTNLNALFLNNQAGQGRNMGGLGLGGQMGPMGAALGLGTSPGRSNAMNSLHAANMSTAFNQPSNNLLAMFNKGGMNGMGTQGFGGHTAGASQNLDQGILSGQVQGQQGQGQGTGQPHKQQTGQQQPEQDGPAFHDSEFPVLGSGGGARQGAGSLSNGDTAGSTGLGALGEAPYANLTQLHKAQMGGGGNFSIQNEAEFPALPGTSEQQRGSEDGQQAAAGQQPPQQQQGYGQIGARMGAFQGLNQARSQQQGGQLEPQLPEARQQGFAPASQNLAMLSGFQAGGNVNQEQMMRMLMQQQQQQRDGQQPPKFARTQQPAPSDPYGLMGLLGVIRMQDPDLTTLALGTDLTGLGLHLNSPENVYSTFASPWAEQPLKAEPEYLVPDCYRHSPARLQPGYLSKFQADTLFYIFYSMPNDEAQVLAADELRNRGWLYHKEFRCWLSKVPNLPPQQVDERMERGSYTVFDPAQWAQVRKDNFVLHYDAVERPPQIHAAQPAQNAVPAAQPPPPPGPRS
ncbi:g4062 [Coccomyxa viridis]|uniref:G4062 protein n=1 Tax=Coccomyxa viridis TaxID=1274662 RepID=A0ABP1FPE6_9CHLO